MAESVLSASLAALLGLLIGSFLNVVIHRIPAIMHREWLAESLHAIKTPEEAPGLWAMVFGTTPPPAPLQPAADEATQMLEGLPPLGIARPRSRCPQCEYQIRWYENIPVISWLLLRGKCAGCKTPISFRYPLVEIATAALAWYCATRYGMAWPALAWFSFGAMLICLTLIDWDTTYLPDNMTLPLLWAGLLATSLGWTGITLSSALWGAVLGYFSLWLIYWLFKLLTGKEGMGYGDFKLFGALGAWLGAHALIPVILLASVIGAIIGIALKINSKLRAGGYVPFGPFLALGGFAAWWLGPTRILQLVGLGG